MKTILSVPRVAEFGKLQFTDPKRHYLHPFLSVHYVRQSCKHAHTNMAVMPERFVFCSRLMVKFDCGAMLPIFYLFSLKVFALL